MAVTTASLGVMTPTFEFLRRAAFLDDALRSRVRCHQAAPAMRHVSRLRTRLNLLDNSAQVRLLSPSTRPCSYAQTPLAGSLSRRWNSNTSPAERPPTKVPAVGGRQWSTPLAKIIADAIEVPR